MHSCFLGGVPGKVHNRYAIADLSEVGGRAVQLDQPLSRVPVDHVGFEPFAVTQITYEDFFIFTQLDKRRQIGRNRKAPLVVQARAGHCRPMNFGLEQSHLHRILLQSRANYATTFASFKAR